MRPLREGDAQLVADFDQYFRDIAAEIVTLSSEVVDVATGIRAAYRFGVPDALHLAASLSAGCDAFLTNDHDLTRFPDMLVELI